MGLKNNAFFKIGILTVIVLSTLSVLAMRNDIVKFFQPKNQQQLVAKKAPVEKERVIGEAESKLLSEYENVLKTIDPARKEYLQKGELSIVGEADSTLLTPVTAYLVCRKDNDCYYQLGNTETYNAAGVYVFIDHNAKKVLLSGQKTMTGDVFTGGKIPGKQIKEEGYKISAVNKGSQRKLILSNPAHPLYKEYALTYDTLSGKVAQIFTRTGNDKDRFAKGKGRLINVRILETSDRADMKSYDPLKVVRLKEEKWELTERFKSYQLVVMGAGN